MSNNALLARLAQDAATYGDDSVALGVLLRSAREAGHELEKPEAHRLIEQARKAPRPRRENGGAPLPIVRSLAEILADPAALEPPAPVVPRLAWRGRVTLLAAREKMGKSTLAGAAAAKASRGETWLGDATAEGAVLWVGLEEHVGDIAARLEEWGADPDRVYLIDSLATVDDPLAAIRAAVHEVEPVLVVVDTLAALVERLAERPDPGSSTAWTPVMAALTRIARETDAAVLLLHHARKSDGAYRDSTAIGAGVDAILEMYESDDAPVRRIKVRSRFRLGDYALRLAGDRYELAAGEVSLDARVLLHVEAHPGTSMRALRGAVTGRGRDIDAAVARLIERGALREGEGAHGARTLYPENTEKRSGETLAAPSGRTRSGHGSVSAENPQGHATDTVAGHGSVSRSTSLGHGRRDTVGGDDENGRFSNVDDPLDLSLDDRRPDPTRYYDD